MNCETCKGHTDLTEETKAVKKAAEIANVYDRQNRRLWIAIIVLAASMIVMAASMIVMARCMVWAVTNAQRLANDAMWQALNTVAEMEVTGETTTTTVNQDTGEGEGNNVYQAGEFATYDEGGAE